MNEKAMFGWLICLMTISGATAQDIIVTKIAPTEITLGDVLTVSITIENNRDADENLTVTEQIVDAEAIEPELNYPEIPEGIIAARPPYFEWNIIVRGKSSEAILYKIKPINVGEYAFTPTVVRTLAGEKVYSNTLAITVKSPINRICEPEKGENYITSPQDCPSGSPDMLCDMVKDGKCDPDCEKTADVDCLCGNDKCETKYGESYNTCPQDCPSGSSDNYCDKVNDGKCDPDCLIAEDSDCEHIPTVQPVRGGGPPTSRIIIATVVVIVTGLLFLIFKKVG